MIKNIELRSEHGTKKLFVDFNKEAYSIPMLYVKSLPNFDSGKVRYCLITLFSHDDFPQRPSVRNFADFYLYFDFNEYFTLNERDKKLMQLQAIHQGMLGIATDYGWDKTPLETAYQNCLSSNLVFEHQIKKRTISPNKKQYLSLWAFCDLHQFKITWSVSDKNGQILKQGVVLTKQPSFIDMWYRLNFHWEDDENFVVESNYKGLVTDTWKVNLTVSG